jgi:hypothetical protein
MHNLGFYDPLHNWFDFKVPKTTVSPDYIEKALDDEEALSFKPNAKIVWLGKNPAVEYFTQSKKGMHREMATLRFTGKTSVQQIQILKCHADWLVLLLEKLSVQHMKTWTLQEVMNDYEAAGLEDFELFWDNKPMSGIGKLGLLRL